ncbi:MAG: YggS family pyridoxal phosphate-dependent enzyme [Acidimicrobiales bacterium]
MIDPGEVAERLEVVRARLRQAGGEAVRVVAVTKGFGADAIEAAVSAGLHDVGESYAQEAVAKLGEADVGANPIVHFIGGLQRNKVRRLAGVVDVWQSVDRVALVDEIARRSPGARMMVQVDISGEEAKGGCPPDEAGGLVDHAAAAGLVVEGLMGIGPVGEPAAARPGFGRLRRLVDDLGLAECSMGMTDDLEVAVGEGSTMIRVGTALFGPRPPRS